MKKKELDANFFDRSYHSVVLITLKSMTAKQKKNIRFFKDPVPVREIGLVTYRYFVKEKLIQSFKKEILNHIPAEVKTLDQKLIVNS